MGSAGHCTCGCGYLHSWRRADLQSSEEETQQKGVGSHRGCGICRRDSGGHSDRPDTDAALTGQSVCRKRMRLGKEFTKEIGIQTGVFRMKNDILLKYRMLNAEEVNREIFKDFIRYQNVTKCWRKENGKWIIKDAPFIDDWTEKDYQTLIFCLKNTIASDGFVSLITASYSALPPNSFTIFAGFPNSAKSARERTLMSSTSVIP